MTPGILEIAKEGLSPVPQEASPAMRGPSASLFLFSPSHFHTLVASERYDGRSEPWNGTQLICQASD
jgi:hypothetical protein